MKASLNIAIFGVGAMGCLFGGYLSRLAATMPENRLNVYLLGNWPAQVSALQSKGLAITTPEDKAIHIPVNAAFYGADLPKADIALILLKSWQTGLIANVASRILKEDGIAVTLQNGLGNKEILASFLGKDRVFAGITSQGANIVEPGKLQHAGHGATFLETGEFGQNKLHSFARWLNQAGFTVTTKKNIAGLSWGKLLINAAINPMSALLNVPNGVLLQKPAHRKMMAAVAAEVVKVANAEGIQLPFPDPAEAVFQVCRATARNISSMCQDIRRGRKTEIEAICGAVVRSGQRHGIATPLNSALLAQIYEKEMDAALRINEHEDYQTYC